MRGKRLKGIDFIQSGCILLSSNQECWIGWGPYVKLSGSRKSSLCLYSPDFFLKDEQPWRVYDQSIRVSLTELKEELQRTLVEIESRLSSSVLPFLASIAWAPAELDSFRKCFDELQTYFLNGTLKKAVPIVLEKGELRGSADTHWAIRCKLLLCLLETSQGHPLYGYGFWDEDEGILGATPEILFEMKEPGQLNTVALAGTRRKSDRLTRTVSLLEDPKELREHQIVIEGILDSLLSLGDLEVGSTHELELPILVHLITPIKLIFSQNTPVDSRFETVVKRLHPTPALGAYPKAEGQKWLESSPFNQERERFGAPFGAVLPGERSLCLVAIRNLQWKGANFKIGAGCGVVPASQLELESEELRAKINSVKHIFGLT